MMLFIDYVGKMCVKGMKGFSAHLILKSLAFIADA